jgi:hypothetical protein
MKGHKAHHHKHPRAEHAKGGAAGEGLAGVDEKDMDMSPSDVYAGKDSKVKKEAEERKRGGKAKKMIGKAMGHKSAHRGDRKPRKSGGRAGSDMKPLSSAFAGTAPKGRGQLEMN